jgi:hypothetical protein
MEPPLWSTDNLDNTDIVYYAQQTSGRRTFSGWNTLDRKYKKPRWNTPYTTLPLKHHFSKILFKNQMSSRRVLDSRLVS